MSWPEKYRPLSFATVRGQEQAIVLLSGLSQKKSYKYPLLLGGSVGSGKTTLLRIYAKALNCDRVDEDGSPCLVCLNCKAPSSAYLKEFNTPLLSSQAGRVSSILTEVVRTPTDDATKVMVYFFDEAQGLSAADQLLMLKIVEDGLPDRVAICFATTAKHKLSPALRSRLFEINIVPIRQDAAIELLKFVAEQEGVLYDLPALYMIVAALPPQARDLVKALQKLASFEKPVDVPLVKNVLDLSICDQLTTYVLALSNQDRGAQTLAITGWNDTWATKIVWLRRFLTTIYYNDVLGQHIVIDPLCHSMDIVRWEFVHNLCSRFSMSNPGALAIVIANWLELLDRPGGVGEDAHALRFVLFETLVSNQMSVPATQDLDEAKHELATNLVEQVESQLAWEWLTPAQGSHYVERSDVRDVISRASYMMQEHGVSFNLSGRIVSDAKEGITDPEQFQKIMRFGHRLLTELPADDTRFAAIQAIERDGATIVGRIVAWIPSLAPGSRCSLRGLEEWARQYDLYIHLSKAASERDVQFHWRAVLELCAGFDGDTDNAGGRKSLRRLLNIPATSFRQPGPFAAPRVIFGGYLTSAALGIGCVNGMAPVSAFDISEWSEVSSGWELMEYPDRKKEAKRRAGAIAQLKAIYKEDGQFAAAKISRLREGWQSSPLGSWPRTWRKTW